MTKRDLEPLDRDLLGLVEAERGRPAPAAGARERVLGRVLATVGAVGGGGAPSGGQPEAGGGLPEAGKGLGQHGGGGAAKGALNGAGSAGGAGAQAGSSGGAAAGGSGGAAGGSGGAAAGSSGGAAAGLASGLVGKALIFGAVVIALGGAAGVAIVREPAPRATAVTFPRFVAPQFASVVPQASRVEADATAVEPPPTDLALAATAKEDPSSPLPRSAPTATSSSAIERDTSLAAERALLDAARASIARGEAAGFALLQRHVREFPRGRLAEEREGLWIRALIAAGRTGEARSRLDRFRRTYPKSMQLPGFAEALGDDVATEPSASPP